MKRQKFLFLILAVIPLYAQADSLNYTCKYISKPFGDLPDSFFVGTSPNPFGPTQTEHFGIPVLCLIKLKLMDVDSNILAETAYCALNQGSYTFNWGELVPDLRAMKSGVYYLKLYARSTENYDLLFKGEKKVIFIR